VEKKIKTIELVNNFISLIYNYISEVSCAYIVAKNSVLLIAKNSAFLLTVHTWFIYSNRALLH